MGLLILSMYYRGYAMACDFLDSLPAPVFAQTKHIVLPIYI
jgi:hypothetical protein